MKYSRLIQFLKTLTNKRGLFIGVLLFGGCYGQIAPLYEAQSSLTSGTLVAAGSIGVVALAATVAVAALSVRRDVRNCYCETTTQTPEESCADKCEDLVASERAKYEKENEVYRQIIQGVCSFQTGDDAENCVTCLNYYNDEAQCRSDSECFFSNSNGVCLHQRFF
nr:uncharacterized protein LOC109619215 isoform X1 [Crassostrea gigas]